ncbi:hypothetical protein P7K49_009213 [Saguinus oedipus]|uniref:Cystatin domain-containing protein n=1 Tax=Saguinus oedipus TaxID=9490 RepID=A0ABQ9VJP1_SAGOE|nr:hypothetical protein P7K49_009213 [Saguinus oedipus]
MAQVPKVAPPSVTSHSSLRSWTLQPGSQADTALPSAAQGSVPIIIPKHSHHSASCGMQPHEGKTVPRGVRAGKDVTGGSGDFPSTERSRPLVPTLETAMWWKVPLLVGFIVLGTRVCSCRFVDTDKNSNYVASAVEYAVFQFNEDQEDEFAYKFLRVHRSQHKTRTWIYLVDLTMGRTVCKKHDEDIDNCPLQEGTEEKMKAGIWQSLALNAGESPPPTAQLTGHRHLQIPQGLCLWRESSLWVPALYLPETPEIQADGVLPVGSEEATEADRSLCSLWTPEGCMKHNDVFSRAWKMAAPVPIPNLLLMPVLPIWDPDRASWLLAPLTAPGRSTVVTDTHLSAGVLEGEQPWRGNSLGGAER